MAVGMEGTATQQIAAEIPIEISGDEQCRGLPFRSSALPELENPMGAGFRLQPQKFTHFSERCFKLMRGCVLGRTSGSDTERGSGRGARTL
jgi:hypothetical protein